MDISKLPTSSVYIPTYNSIACLKKLLNALEQKTVVPDNMIIVDSNSQDETGSMARKYGCLFYSIGEATFADYLLSRRYVGVTPWIRWMPYAIEESILRVFGCRQYFKSDIKTDGAVYRNE